MKICKAPKTKKPGPVGGVGLRVWRGGDLLSLEIHPTIIGAESFHSPVRDGKEWFQLAMVVRQFGRPLDSPPHSGGSQEI